MEHFGKVQRIYFCDDSQATLWDLRIAIPDAWQMPDMGQYIDEHGSVTARPPFNEKLIIRPLSQMLAERVENYR